MYDNYFYCIFVFYRQGVRSIIWQLRQKYTVLNGHWKTQYNAEVFVTHFIYNSNEFEDNTSMKLVEDKLVFKLNGKERSLYLATDLIQKELTFNHAILYSMGICPIKNKSIYELHHRYLEIVHDGNNSFPVPSTIECIKPLMKQIELRQGALWDHFPELEFAFCDLEDTYERMLNTEKYPKEDIFKQLINSERKFVCYPGLCQV